MKTLTVLGATGSIGRTTLNIVSRFPQRFRIAALSARSNIELLAAQIEIFKPRMAVVYDQDSADRLKGMLPPGVRTELLVGSQGYQAAAEIDEVDMVVAAMMGAAGLKPVLAAITAGKDVALANKETLVMAGSVVIKAAQSQSVRLLPVDSEHSAIFQCLQGNRRQDLDRIFLTASGGPFLRTPADQFEAIKPEHALNHPNWKMGSKITIDSATLMNKGLEIIEAKWLFDLDPKQIKVLVHPQSIIHSMVAFCDGSVMAQMGVPDMQTAIAYALSYPIRMRLQQAMPDFASIKSLTFEEPDEKRFPCLSLAIEACTAGGTLPAVLNAANETAVHAFLAGELSFIGIAELVRAVMSEHIPVSDPDLDAILAADAWARRSARTRLEELNRNQYTTSLMNPFKEKT